MVDQFSRAGGLHGAKYTLRHVADTQWESKKYMNMNYLKALEASLAGWLHSKRLETYLRIILDTTSN